MEERRRIGAFYYRFATGERLVTLFCLRRCVTYKYHSLNSGSDVFDRVSTFLETLYRDMAKGGCGDNAILVSHGLFCRLFLTRFYHWSVCDDNCLLEYLAIDCPNRLRSFTKCGILTTASLPSWNYNRMVTTS